MYRLCRTYFLVCRTIYSAERPMPMTAAPRNRKLFSGCCFPGEWKQNTGVSHTSNISDKLAGNNTANLQIAPLVHYGWEQLVPQWAWSLKHQGQKRKAWKECSPSLSFLCAQIAYHSMSYWNWKHSAGKLVRWNGKKSCRISVESSESTTVCTDLEQLMQKWIHPFWRSRPPKNTP